MELEKLLYLQGVGAEFIDCFGNHIHIPAADREGILKTMCLDGRNAPWSEPWVVARIDELDAKPWQLAMASFQWCFIDEPSISVYLPDGFVEPLTFALTTESGETCEFVVTISQMIRRGDYRIGHQVYGHYQYHLDHHGLSLHDNRIFRYDFETMMLQDYQDRLTKVYQVLHCVDMIQFLLFVVTVEDSSLQ